MRVLLLVGLIGLGLVGCDTKTPDKPAEPTTVPSMPPATPPNPIPEPVPVKPIRLPSLTIPPYTLKGDENAEPLPGLGTPEETPSDLRLHYYVTTPKSYTDILVEYGEIHYTYFPDVDGKCRNWKKSEPCWTKNDLDRIGKALTQEDLDNLTAIVLENKLLDLDKDVYGATPKPRKIDEAQAYTVFLDNTERNFTYYPAPLAKKPEGLARLETALIQYARDLEAEVYHPLPKVIPNRPGAE